MAKTSKQRRILQQAQALGITLALPDWRDASGRDMKRGQYIAYSAGAGRRAVLKFGIVTDLISRPDQRWEAFDPPPPPPGTYPRGDYKPMLVPKIKVITTFRGSVQKTGSKVTLEHLKRVLIVDEHQIPPSELQALKDAWQGANQDE